MSFRLIYDQATDLTSLANIRSTGGATLNPPATNPVVTNPPSFTGVLRITPDQTGERNSYSFTPQTTNGKLGLNSVPNTSANNLKRTITYDYQSVVRGEFTVFI